MCLAIRGFLALALTTAPKCALVSKVVLPGPFKKGKMGKCWKIETIYLFSTNKCWLKTTNGGVIFNEDWVSGGLSIGQ